MEAALAICSVRPSQVWRLFRESHPETPPESEICWLDQKRRRAAEVEREIDASGKPHFGVYFDGGELSYGDIGRRDLSLVILKGCVVDAPDARAWIEPFLKLDAFVHARVYDEEYEYWQKADDPLQYEAVGKEYRHLPMKWNGLPYPLRQRIIDTSGNPGRRVFRSGYIEAVGAVMWLGQRFWARTGARRESVLAAAWLRCSEIPGGVLEVKAADHAFTAADGREGQLQERMRDLLFPGSRSRRRSRARSSV